MRVLAIDPGNTESAWCDVADGSPNGFLKESNFLVLERLRTLEVGGVLLAVEMIASYGMPVGREIFETCLWVGRFVEAWDKRGGKHYLVYRRDVKLHLCADSRAKDSNIRQALLDRYGPGRQLAIGTKKNPGPLYGMAGDCWAALAVGVTVQGIQA